MRSGLVVVGIVAFALASCATIPTGQDANAAVPMLQKKYDAWAWAVGIALIWADLVLPVPQTVVIAALGIIRHRAWGPVGQCWPHLRWPSRLCPQPIDRPSLHAGPGLAGELHRLLVIGRPCRGCAR